MFLVGHKKAIDFALVRAFAQGIQTNQLRLKAVAETILGEAASR
jgi:hypothetical protein